MKTRYSLALLNLGYLAVEKAESKHQLSNQKKVRSEHQENVRHLVVQVLTAYSRRATKLCKMIYGDTSKETLKWRERRDKTETNDKAKDPHEQEHGQIEEIIKDDNSKFKEEM